MARRTGVTLQCPGSRKQRDWGALWQTMYLTSPAVKWTIQIKDLIQAEEKRRERATWVGWILAKYRRRLIKQRAAT